MWKTEISHGLESISLPPPPPPPTPHINEKQDWSQKSRALWAQSSDGKSGHVQGFVEQPKLAANFSSDLCLFCSFQLNGDAVGKVGKQNQRRWGASACLCVQLVYTLYNLFVLILLFFYELHYGCTFVCTCLCVCEPDACSYYPAFLKQTNGLKPSAEHSSGLGSVSYVGCHSSYRDIRGLD